MMTAGNDLLMPGSPNQIQAIIKAVQDGKFDEKILDRNVENILSIILKSPRFKGYKYSNKPDLAAHAQIARQAATEGMVLLKNADAALPFAKEVKTIAAFGNTSYEIITGGTGTGDVNEAYSVSLVEGLKNAGYAVLESLQSLYAAYLQDGPGKPAPGRSGASCPRRRAASRRWASTADLVEGLAGQADVAVITIGRNSGEGRDRSEGEGDFQLTAAERDLIKIVSAAFQAKGKKTVVILQCRRSRRDRLLAGSCPTPFFSPGRAGRRRAIPSPTSSAGRPILPASWRRRSRSVTTTSPRRGASPGKRSRRRHRRRPGPGDGVPDVPGLRS